MDTKETHSLHNLLDAKNRDELRQWLEQNHATERECWVAVKRGKKLIAAP